MNYNKRILQTSLDEVRQQKLELIVFTKDKAPEEIRKIEIIEKQIELELRRLSNQKISDKDKRAINRLVKKKYTIKEISIIYRTAPRQLFKILNKCTN